MCVWIALSNPITVFKKNEAQMVEVEGFIEGAVCVLFAHTMDTKKLTGQN